MFPRKHRPVVPLLLGEPSPSLAKISKMNMTQLAQHMTNLAVEQKRLETKIRNLSLKPPIDEPRIADLNKQIARLRTLIELANERLKGKAERAQQYDAAANRLRLP